MKKKYAIVGTGGRSEMYFNALTGGEFDDCAELVALCDMNQGRLDFYNAKLEKPLPTYRHDQFEQMIKECKVDTVIITTIDRTHHIYGCRAMELGCDVISEKPMTVDAEKCRMILDTQKKTGKNYIVTFNYRYSPRNTRVKELLMSGICGEITSVNFEWMLDTSHGADYFRRWHRNKRNSGGLMVHKATHHFDLVNWWLDSVPESVYALGDLKFYGRENAEKRGVTEFYSRAKDDPVAAKDPFALIVEKDSHLDKLYYQNEKYDAYIRDQSVFSDGIDIEDNMSVMVRYRNKVVMNYTLCAHCPYEGYRICFNGTKGRLEFYVIENPQTGLREDLSHFGMREANSIGGGDAGSRKNMAPEILFQPFWGKPQSFTYEMKEKTGHGGGDKLLLKNIFRGVTDDPFRLAADFHDGAWSIMTGICANISMRTGEAVRVLDVLGEDL